MGRTRPFVIGHRGAAGLAPENTLAAIEAGIRQGASHVEVDVRRCADGVLVLMHDTAVERTTDGAGAVADLTWDQIRKLDAGSHFAPAFAGEKVPRLDDALALIVERGVGLLLEAKDPGLYPGIETQIAQVIERAGASERVVVISFDHGWLRRFRQVAPDIPVGPLWFRPGPGPVIPATQLVSVHWTSVLRRPEFVRRMHRQGYQVVAWTVNRAWQMRLLVWLGVDGITTDRPDVWQS